MPLAAANLQAIILDYDCYGVLAQLVERLNGIEGFLLCKLFVSNVTRSLCHKLLSQSVAARGRHGAV
jgi:hypothetical protein